MSRSVRDLREFICLSRFGFRPDDIETPRSNENEEKNLPPNLLFYFDPSILNNWLELTSSRLEKLRSLSPAMFVEFAHFWLKLFDDQHKRSLFQMEFELFVEHLILAFTPNDTNSNQINQFARDILHDFPPSNVNDRQLIETIDIFNRCQRDDQYRNLLANLPTSLLETTVNRLHLQWALAIRAFGLVTLCTAAAEFFEKIHQTLEQKRSNNETNFSSEPASNVVEQTKQRILITLRKDYVDVMDYLIETNQITGDSLDDQNRNVLFHALPLGNPSMIEHLLKAPLLNLNINGTAQSGNSLVHLCVSLQRVDLLQLIVQHRSNVDLNIRNQQDATPLHLAIIYGDVPMVEFLLRSGGKANLSMKAKTSLQLAKEFHNETLINLFSTLA